MKDINFNTFDLNLVRVFIAMWELRSVTLAAERLNLTQPAVSHALKRLREYFDDPLFVRDGQIMEPTVAAEKLQKPFHDALEILRFSASNYNTFDPKKSDRKFILAMSDVAEACLLPTLLRDLSIQSPNARLQTVPLNFETLEVKLRSGQIDAAIGFLPQISGSGLRKIHLFNDRFECLLSKDHPFDNAVPDEGDLRQLSFVDVAQNATGYEKIRQVLEHKGLALDIRLRIETFTVIPEIVRTTNLAAIYPSSLAQQLPSVSEFKRLPLPADLPKIDISLYFYEFFQGDEGMSWMSSKLQQLFGAQQFRF